MTNCSRLTHGSLYSTQPRGFADAMHKIFVEGIDGIRKRVFGGELVHEMKYELLKTLKLHCEYREIMRVYNEWDQSMDLNARDLLLHARRKLRNDGIGTNYLLQPVVQEAVEVLESSAKTNWTRNDVATSILMLGVIGTKEAAESLVRLLDSGCNRKFVMTTLRYMMYDLDQGEKENANIMEMIVSGIENSKHADYRDIEYLNRRLGFSEKNKGYYKRLNKTSEKAELRELRRDLAEFEYRDRNLIIRDLDRLSWMAKTNLAALSVLLSVLNHPFLKSYRRGQAPEHRIDRLREMQNKTLDALKLVHASTKRSAIKNGIETVLEFLHISLPLDNTSKVPSLQPGTRHAEQPQAQ